MSAPRIALHGLLVIACGCLPRSGDGETPQAVTRPAIEPAPATAPVEVASESATLPDPCVELATCCKGIDGEEFCRKEVANGEPLQCALSIYWSDCPDLAQPDVHAGDVCFRSKDGCYDSLLAACRAQGCERDQGAHGCYVTGEDKRQVGCGDW